MAKNYIPKHNSIKLYTIALLSLIDELVLTNDNNGEYTIPLFFGQGDRRVKRKNYNLSKPYPKYSQTLPSMSLTLVDFVPNNERQTNKFLKRKRISIENNDTQYLVGWNDVNVDINYNLKIRAKNIEELLHIAEFITSIFKYGRYYIDVKHIMYDNSISTPIILNTTELEIENYEDEASAYRLVEASISFTVKGILINNIQSLTKTILEANLNIYQDLELEKLIQSYELGLYWFDEDRQVWVDDFGSLWSTKTLLNN